MALDPGPGAIAPGAPSAGQEWRAGWLMRILLGFLTAIFLCLPGGALIADGSSGGAIFGWVLLALGVGLIGFLFWQQSGLRLVLHPDRLEKHGRVYNKTLRWADLTEYTYIPQQRNTTYGYGAGGLVGLLIVAAVEAATRGNQKFPPPMGMRLKGRDGTKLFVSNVYSGHVQIIQTLTAAATDALVPRTLAAFKDGQTLSFGKRLTVQRDAGLTYRGLFGTKQLPLAALDRAALIEGSRFLLRHQGRVWARFMLSQLPNAFVLVALINEQRQPAASAVTPSVAPPTAPQGAIQ